MLSSCQSGCNFCHLEGYKSEQEIGTLNPALSQWRTTGKLDNLVTAEDIQNSIKIARSLGLSDVNLTGGEPTLHPNIIEYINLLGEAGLSVAMTTHAEMSTSKFQEFLHSRLSWVIISLHAVTPEQYVDMDLIAQQLAKSHSYETAVKYANNKIRNKLQNLEQAVEAQKNGLIDGILTNTVMLNVEQSKQIISYCNDRELLPRIQRDLNEKVLSQKLLEELVKSLNAVCVKEIQAIGDSSAAGYDYEYTDSVNKKTCHFRLKDFGNVYVNAMCGGCKKKNSIFCREKFYGVRIEPGKIRTCIDLDHKNITTFTPEDFISQIDIPGTVPGEIFAQYQEAMNRRI
jgi:organic radical activating enzyme